MMNVSKFFSTSFTLLLLFAWTVGEAQAQFLYTWLDIGEMQSRYMEVGAHPEGSTGNRSVEWPAILRNSGHYRSKAFWIGVKNWTDETGRTWEYHNSRVGPRPDGASYFTPIETRLVSKWEDTEVLVDGAQSFSKIAIVDEVDPSLPSDRMLYHKYRSKEGMETERWAYAYSNEIHDDYHIIVRKFTNTGNIDDDDEIELEGQTLNDVMFFNVYRWVGRRQAADHMDNAQTWGKYSMVDVVGDGNGAYPVDFTAIYLWAGKSQQFSGGWDEIGAPMLTQRSTNFPGDTIGRLAGMSMQGRIVLHADESTTDPSYNPANQPITMGFLDSDEPLNADGSSEQDYYELGILTRENPKYVEGGASRMFPHYADRIEPSGEFWNATNDASSGKQGGFAATMAYGPYQMGFGETITVVEAEAAAGLSYAAATAVGRAFKQNGLNKNALIDYDANGDGVIDTTPWNYDVYDNGGERLTKNQWVMTARDSMFKAMYKARDVWDASNGMTVYPVVEPPRPPKTFDVRGLPDKISMAWETLSGASDPDSWEIYRTNSFEDKLPYNLITTLPGSARSFEDANLIRGVAYYYYIVGVKANQTDATGMNPGTLPLRSGRYFTQTYSPATLKRPPGATVDAFRIVPNPINLASDESVRFYVEGDQTRSLVQFFDIPGNCTITIYTETGEFVNRIEHTDGSGDESWNLTTQARQPLVTGIYLVRVVDNETGAADLKKMVIIQ